MIVILFPHQLFPIEELPKESSIIYLIEEHLFFRQYKFHVQKIAFQRASMKHYEQELLQAGKKVSYIESRREEADIRTLISSLSREHHKEIILFDPTDNWLEKRIRKSCKENGISVTFLENPSFLNTVSENKKLFPANRKKFLQNNFYIYQRKKLNILLNDLGLPLGGKWSFDDQNRKRYPKGKTPPPVQYPESNAAYQEANNYTLNNFTDHYGKLSSTCLYPTNRMEAKKWLEDFLEHRFAEFGPYEDAILSQQNLLHHSLLSPLLNSGLLLPGDVIKRTLEFGHQNSTPIASLEGFIRQIIGWREFIRAIYNNRGSQQRTHNYWGFKRKIPKTFYNGETGIVPIDITIKKVLNTGYCHHIERLMVLGNFMLLCEFEPDEVYRWFMELFIDAYDWVMVPNVYGMSQFADGGIFATKPYISGSNYLMKMSDYPKGEWQETWDALFWRFLHQNRDFFLKNPRLSMLIRTWDKMDPIKKDTILSLADTFLQKMDRTNE